MRAGALLIRGGAALVLCAHGEPPLPLTQDVAGGAQKAMLFVRRTIFRNGKFVSRM